MNELLNFLGIHLGQYSPTKTGIVFYCPNCHHYKKKLNINTTTGEYNCWTCNIGGRSLPTLFTKLKNSNKINTFTSNDFNILYDILHRLKIVKKSHKKEQSLPIEQTLTLPKEYQPLKGTSYYQKILIKKLLNRNVTNIDIQRNNIGYCIDGKYKDRVIFPSYDINGKLNFYVTWDPLSRLKYILSDVHSDNIIFNEIQINWDLPIIICEGVFDAITINYNSIPLIGKRLSTALEQKIIDNFPPKIYLCLDGDALKDALRMFKQLRNHNGYLQDINIVQLPKDKDPNDLSRKELWNLIDNSITITDFEYLKIKLNQ